MSLSFSTLAQTLTQAKAEAAAEIDAKRDVKEPFWFALGGGICVLSGIGTCAGCIVGILASGSSGFGFAPGINTQGLQKGVSIVEVSLLPFQKIYEYNPAPPPERLLGKTPEYVQYYTQAYQREAKITRIKWASIGAGSCGILTISSTIIFLRMQN